MEDEKIAVSNAGMIILWPFLSTYFESLGLAEQGEFINAESQNRAVYLLQYLVYNQTEFEGYHLSLNKILVGFPIEYQSEKVFNLTEEEVELSRSLMNGLINNWDKVKDSSPFAIQESFFQRDGLLSLHQEEIRLQIEKKGFDILMQSIPWELSLIKLPWMQKPLYIEWL